MSAGVGASKDPAATGTGRLADDCVADRLRPIMNTTTAATQSSKPRRRKATPPTRNSSFIGHPFWF